METKANYLLIGVFTILGFLGVLGFVAWFSKIELDQQFSYYDVYFPNVSGLDRASTVKFAGLAVGQVVDMELAPSGDGTVRVVLEVQANTPLRSDSIAKIEAQGVTGVSFVGLSAGSPDQPRLPESPRLSEDTPTITAGVSTLQALSDKAPLVIDRALDAMDRLNGFMSPENEALVNDVLVNLAASSAQLNTTLTEFSDVATHVGDSVDEIANFTIQLEGMTGSVQSTLDAANLALETIDDFATKAEVTLDAGTRMLQSADETISLTGEFINNEVAALAVDFTETSATLRAQADLLSGDASQLLRTWEQTGEVTTKRLKQAEIMFADVRKTLATFDDTLVSITTASRDFDTLITGDGSAFVNEASQLMRTANRALVPLADAAETDLPAVLADLRSTAAVISANADRIGDDLTSASARVDDIAEEANLALEEITETFARSRGTLDAIDRALGSAETTFIAAEGAMIGAERVINQDISPLTASLRGTITRLNRALDQVSEDIPAVSSSLLSAAQSADAAAGRLGRMMTEVDGPVTSFAKDGLPRYTHLAQEARALVQRLEHIAAKIERDPARYLLGGETPRYRR